MMKHVLREDLPFERYFEDICQYPHGSFAEQPLSDHLVDFAKKLQLQYKQDSLGNVIIYKPATPGKEQSKPIILQSHIDMIWEKRPESTFDFTKDPLQLQVTDGWIHAMDTTLGADDGVGVAYMMAVLADKTIAHPPLECLFTVQEEVGCAGAAQLEAQDFHATRLLSLDEMSGNQTTVSGAGMNRVITTYHASQELSTNPCYELVVSGLIGGHSGDDIHKERGNANTLIGRILFQLMQDDVSLQVASIDGGTVDNAISRTCKAIFSSALDAAVLQQRIDGITKDIQEELKYSDSGFTTTLQSCQSHPVYTTTATKDILTFLFVCPDGFRHRSLQLQLTMASSNLGIIQTKEGNMTTSIYVRGGTTSFVNLTAQQIRTVAALTNWQSDVALTLPCWAYREDSPLRATLKEAYQHVMGKSMEDHAEHGCLEAGHFLKLNPDMDITTLGPKVVGYHTFDEKVNRESFAEIYAVLVELLARL